MSKMVPRYQEGATVYELAVEFDCHRTTVSARLKKAGVSLRLQSPKLEDVDSMVIPWDGIAAQLCPTGLVPLPDRFHSSGRDK